MLRWRPPTGLSRSSSGDRDDDLLSARELKTEIDYYSQNLRTDYLDRMGGGKRYLLDGLEEKVREGMEQGGGFPGGSS